MIALRFRFSGRKIIEEALIKGKGGGRKSDCIWQDLATIESPELRAEAAEYRPQDQDERNGKERSSSSSIDPGPSVVFNRSKQHGGVVAAAMVGVHASMPMGVTASTVQMMTWGVATVTMLMATALTMAIVTMATLLATMATMAM
eukprot:3985830-Pleurochrysis_carterae.AAC.1